MHLKEINDNYYQNILTHIKGYLPSFETIFDKEDVYPIAFEFGNYLIDNYSNKEILRAGTDFINEALQTGSSLTEDLIVLQVFHLLYENKTRYKEFENNLTPVNRNLYEKYYTLWKKDFN